MNIGIQITFYRISNGMSRKCFIFSIILSIYIYTGNLLIIVKKYGGKKYQINYNVIIILALNDTLESLKVDLHLKKIKVTLVNDSRVEVEDEVFLHFSVT